MISSFLGVLGLERGGEDVTLCLIGPIAIFPILPMFVMFVMFVMYVMYVI